MSDVNWRRTLAVSSLLMALLLIAGSIYLHVRQKHHFGRMRLEQRVVPQSGVDEITAPCSVYETELANKMRPQKDNSSNSDSHSKNTAFSISEMCLHCICMTATECQPTTCSSSNDPCGIFRISRPYWYDAGKLVLDGDESEMDSFDEGMQVITRSQQNTELHGYTHCVNNAYCAARTVNAYISKYKRDCNNDGKIDCRDYIELHVLGPSGCLSKELMPVFENRMENCLALYT